MRRLGKFLCVFLAILFVSVGYAQISDNLSMVGSTKTDPPQYDIYITNVTPSASGTVTVDHYISTVMSSSVNGASQATFEITVKNQSEKTYVYERIVEGKETGIDGVYSGDGVAYTLDGLTYLQEVAPGKEVTFRVTIKADSTVNTNALLTQFKFIEKTGSEVLPGEPDEPDTPVDPDEPDSPDEPDIPIDTEHNFRGLLDYILSENDRCLNDPNDSKKVIYSAVQKEIKNPPHILHCLTNAISGGNMTNITTAANDELSVKMHFLFMPDMENKNIMYLYMYHMDDATEDKAGEQALTYFCVISYDAGTDEWTDNGVYVGKATVAKLDGGGNSGKLAWMIDPATWTAGAPTP